MHFDRVIQIRATLLGRTIDLPDHFAELVSRRLVLAFKVVFPRPIDGRGDRGHDRFLTTIQLGSTHRRLGRPGHGGDEQQHGDKDDSFHLHKKLSGFAVAIRLATRRQSG